MFRVYKEFIEDGKIVKYVWGDYSDRNVANEVALSLRELIPDMFSSSVEEVEGDE